MDKHISQNVMTAVEEVKLLVRIAAGKVNLLALTVQALALSRPNIGLHF